MAGVFHAYDVAQDYNNIDFVKVGTDTLQNGYAVVATTLAGSYNDGFGDIYNPTKPAAITDTDIAIVDAEDYYQDELGNRIDIDDPTVITFKTGARVRVFRPVLHKKYFASNDTYTGTAAVGSYLIPTANSYGWTVASDLTDNPKVAFLIEAINVKDYFVGLQALTGVRLRCVRQQGI
jgi:hypothetical protein